MEESIKVGSTQMPSVGLGLWKIEREQVAHVVRQAIQLGYRHLDSAADYGNELEVGHGIKQALDEGLCKREELWITSKLWNTYHAAEHVEQACDKTLADLASSIWISTSFTSPSPCNTFLLPHAIRRNGSSTQRHKSRR